MNNNTGRSWLAIVLGIGVTLSVIGDRHTLAQGSAGPASSAGPPACLASQLLLTADSKDGNFAGMSQNGSYLLVKNVSSTACGFSPLPQLTLFDARHSALAINPVVRGTEHMHPGPVVLPISLQPGSVVGSTLHWISGPVWVTKDGGVCLESASIGLNYGQGTLNAKLDATVCGPKPGKVKVDITRFAKPANL